MDDTGAFARMLGSLRTTFKERLPTGLTTVADNRLQRTLQHFIKEIVRVHGSLYEREVLRETFDSMAAWFRRRPTELLTLETLETPERPERPEIEHAVAPDLMPGGGGLAAIGGSPFVEEDVNAALERFRRARDGVSSTPIADIQAPELLSTDLRSTWDSAVQQKDIIQRQESVVKYREVETNLILNSKDRDWLNNMSSQNRYQFSVYPESNKPQGSGNQLFIMKQFRNIVRLEFVKAILPVEALDIGIMPVLPLIPEQPPQTTADKAFYSVLSMPFINVTCSEQVGNNIGTNDTVDRSLAICQYDAAWRSDLQPNEHRLNRGYTLFFPKFMKAHRLYQPTPLGSFQKLTFEILNPENQPLSRIPDASPVSWIMFSNALGPAGGPGATSPFIDTAGQYLFVQLNPWFSQWSYSKVDKVTFAGIRFTYNPLSVQADQAALTEWMQGPDGHLVLGIAHSDPSSGLIMDGPNSCGFANWIILQNRMLSTTTPNGTCSLQPFSPSGDDTHLATILYRYSKAEGGVLNLSRQVQMVLRVVCRELDAATNIRPDNA